MSTKRIIRLKGPSRLYLVSPYPFKDCSPFAPFVCWDGKQSNAFRFRTAKQAYMCLVELRDYQQGKDGEVVRLVKR